MIDKRTYILLFCGFAGIILFFFLRPNIDYFASGAISESKDQVEQNIKAMAPELGFSADSLAIMSMRKQHLNYYDILTDTMGNEVEPAKLNQAALHLQSWESVLGTPYNSSSAFASTEELFKDAGSLKFNVSNAGRVIRMSSNPESHNPTFVKGDSLLALASHVVQDIFSYNLDEYELTQDLFDTNGNVINEGQNPQRNLSENSSGEALRIQWERKAEVVNSPETLTLELVPVVREIDSEAGFRTEFGFSITSFEARNTFEPQELSSSGGEESNDELEFSYVLFSVLFILVILIFAIGTRNIFKGKVEWRRALAIFVLMFLGTYGWRAIFFMNSYDPFLSSTGVFIGTINNLLFGLVVGLYASLAYISWEALARSQNQKQVDLVDALWQRNFFLRETGAGLVQGIALGGIVIGMMSVLAYAFDVVLVQADSQFGFAEAGITPKVLTINMSAWTATWLVATGQIGFIYSILKSCIKRDWLVSALSVILIGISITVLGRLIGTNGSVWTDMGIYIGIAIIFVYAIREFGLLTVSTAWWFFTVFFLMLPYVGSDSLNVSYVAWGQYVFMALILMYGFVINRYGQSISEVEVYIPEYEERINQHLRVEKEIEIARESQLKLMPLQAPKSEAFDVYGFFMPSFEVGGDYFDYILTEDEQGNAEALTMTVVDVSGKSMRAAMPAVFTSGLLLSRIKHDCPDEVLSDITEPLFDRTDKRTFITCVLARYDIKAQKLAIANAGHCRPILKRNGIAEYIHTPKPSFPLGMQKHVKYQRETVSVKKGDFFLLYSDGLPEAVNEKGERFGFDEVPRLIESIDTDKLTAKEISKEIKRTIQKFSNYQLADDTTIICLKI